MSEHDLAIYAYKVLDREQQLQNLEKRIEGLEKPERPEYPISYEDGVKLQKEKDEHSHNLAQLNKQKNNLENEIGEYRRQIKQTIPTQNTEIRVSIEQEGKKLAFGVKHVTSDGNDKVEINKF